MGKKKIFSMVALLCIVIALMIYSFAEKESQLHDFFWIPLVLSAVFLFIANRVK